MAQNIFQYLQLAPNFRLITNTTEQNGVKFTLHHTAGGAFFEEKGQKGLSHLLEHCMVARTKKHDFEDLRYYLFENDIHTNAFTGRLGMDIVVSGHKKNFDAMLDLVLEFAFNPVITEEILEQEKEIVLCEISQYSGGVGYRLNMTLIKSLYKKGSYSRTEVLGRKDDVRNATIRELQKIQKRLYAKSNFILTVAGGGVDSESVKSRFEKIIPHYTEQDTLPVNFTPKNELRDFTYLPVVDYLGHQHAVLNVIIPCPINFENRPVRMYLRELLFENPIGVLYTRLRNQLGFIYSLRYSFDLPTQALNIEVSCEIEHIPQIVEEIQRYFAEPSLVINESKINKIRELLMTRRELYEDNPQFVVDFLVGILLDFGVIMYYDDYIKLLETITVQDVRDYYDVISENIDKMKIVVVSNKEEIKQLRIP
jgi:predicted Zn-dependent peptidase